MEVSLSNGSDGMERMQPDANLLSVDDHEVFILQLQVRWTQEPRFTVGFDLWAWAHNLG
jgi:hypothetical protein